MKRFTKGRRFFDLRAYEPVARGKQRDIFLIQGKDAGLTGANNAVVLKVPRYAERYDRLSRPKQTLRKVYATSEQRVILKEAAYWRKVNENWDHEAAPLPIPRFLGLVETSAGVGALWNAVSGDNGKLAPTLKEIIARNEMADALDPLNEFVNTYFNQNLVAADLHFRNIVFGQEAGVKQFFLVDGFGDHRMISIRGRSAMYNHKKLIHACCKLARRANLTFEPDRRAFSLPS